MPSLRLLPSPGPGVPRIMDISTRLAHLSEPGERGARSGLLRRVEGTERDLRAICLATWWPGGPGPEAA